MKKIIYLLCIITFTGSIFAKEVINLDGTVITVPDKIERVAALFGPSYERLFLLDVEDRIIADGDFHSDGWPWSNIIYKRLDKIQGIPNAHTELNMEEILKMKPDLVFYWNMPKAVAKMKEVGITAVPAVITGKLEDTKNTMLFYARLFGPREQQRAEEYAAYFDEKIAYVKNITSKIKMDKRPKVYMANQEILWTYCKGSDIPDLIELAGGICVHKDAGGTSRTEINNEQLLQWNPDFIFIDHAGSSGNTPAENVIEKSLKDNRLKQVTGFRKNQVYINPTGVFFWDSGVQKILLLLFTAKTIHPAAFRNFDMQAELKFFYKKFFRYDLTDDEAEKIMKHRNP